MIEITIQKLSVRYGAAPALDGVDLRIAPGELFLDHRQTSAVLVELPDGEKQHHVLMAIPRLLAREVWPRQKTARRVALNGARVETSPLRERVNAERRVVDPVPTLRGLVRLDEDL